MILRLDNIWTTYFDFHYGTAAIFGTIFFILFTVILYSARKKQKKAIEKKDVAILLLFSVYMTFLLGVTLFNRQSADSYRLELHPLWSYVETVYNGDQSLGLQIFYNIVAFIPLGIFLPFLSSRMRRPRNILIAGALLSAAIECSQLIFKCGLCELDDVLDNTIGAVIGYAVWKGWGMVLEKIKSGGDYSENIL